ncbi:hypothetical protein Pcinc_002416 [Petrolisthes cinctipes]|uniref:L1 transposable element RRM domain-containing protein n=1 Tax=Petrolisthes cinctipes TaxID=88211 RepID=A0AAE1L281_PETCI|nr:hypothetical protein Pcinc_002416 [Petrolisthes cinctipes]
MDLDAVKVLLESQERTFRSALELVVEQWKERIRLVEGKMTDLTKSHEFSQAEILDLKNNEKVLQKLNKEKQVAVEELQSRVAELNHQLNYQEDYTRHNNLRISGLKEQPIGETWEQTAVNVSKILEDKLQLPSVNLERAHRVGPAAAAASSHPRAVVVRFRNFSDREAAIRNASKLKGTGIYINEDLCPASLKIKKKQFLLMKKAREDGKIAFFRHTRLIIRERIDQRSSSSVPAADSPHVGAGFSGWVAHGDSTVRPPDGTERVSSETTGDRRVSGDSTGCQQRVLRDRKKT